MYKDKVKGVFIVTLIWIFAFVIIGAFIVKLKSLIN